jgi:hypothetical protein
MITKFIIQSLLDGLMNLSGAGDAWGCIDDHLKEGFIEAFLWVLHLNAKKSSSLPVQVFYLEE